MRSRRIAEAAEGNPLFVEEMLLMLIDDGLLTRDNGQWAATGDVAAIRVPPTIQALLAARVDRLDEDERSVIERAAVVGKVFYEAAVVDLVPEALRPSVTDALATLARKQLIRPDRPSLGGRTFGFRHLLIRDAAYESIPKEVPPSCTTSSAAGWTAPSATVGSNTKRSSATTWNRRTATGLSSGRSTRRRARSPVTRLSA